METNVCIEYLKALADYQQEKTRAYREILSVKAKAAGVKNLPKMLEHLDWNESRGWAKVLALALHPGVPPELHRRLLLLSPMRRHS